VKLKTNIILNAIIFLFSIFPIFAQDANIKKEAKGILSFQTFPDSVKVSIDNKFIGITPLEIKLAKGQKLVKFEKSGYATDWKIVTCKENLQVTVKAELKPITGSIIISSIPLGVGVELNGEFKGETPLLLKNLPIGKYIALLSKQGFVAKEISWVIDTSRPQIIEKNLSSNIGTVNIKSIPEEANVFIDDAPRGKTPFTADMTEGQYKLKVTQTGYAPYEYLFVLKRGGIEDITAKLEELPGSLSIKSNPSDSIIFLNGRQYENTPVLIKNLLPGDYKLKIENKGFDPVYQKVTVYRGQENSVNIDLKDNTGSIGLIINPPGVSVYINGKFSGVSIPDEKNPQISKVFTVSNLPEGEYTVKCVHKRAKPTTKEIIINVAKGETMRAEPINLWVADHILTLSSGKRYEGRLRYQNDKIISFEIVQGVTQDYKKYEVKSLVAMTKSED